MTLHELTQYGAVLALAGPALVVTLLGIATFGRRQLSERIVGSATVAAMGFACVALAVACVAFALGDHETTQTTVLPPARGQTFALDLIIDARGLAFSFVAAFICAIVAVFGHRYMHREAGYFRYFAQFNLLFLGTLLVGLGGSTTLLFAGWEFLGLSSALLVAFFHERPAPVANALRVFTIYRLGDAAMLSAAVLAQQQLGGDMVGGLFGADGAGGIDQGTATAIGLLLLVAAAAKCAQLPFSGWLPRAMEGPTPSSAVFYGALSIHAGAFVLLRAGPLLDAAPMARVAIGLVGLATLLFATTAGRVQTDVKSALAFASLTQVSIILIEIAFGLNEVALVHMIGHALYRLLQFLRAPSILHDFHQVAQATGGHLGRGNSHVERFLPRAWQPWLYRFALERGFLDTLLDRFVVLPFVTVAASFDNVERGWCARVAGRRRPRSASPSEDGA